LNENNNDNNNNNSSYNNINNNNNKLIINKVVVLMFFDDLALNINRESNFDLVIFSIVFFIRKGHQKWLKTTAYSSLSRIYSH